MIIRPDDVHPSHDMSEEGILISDPRCLQCRIGTEDAAGFRLTLPCVPVPMSTCNKCGERHPSAPVGTIHKCGVCSGGMMVRDAVLKPAPPGNNDGQPSLHDALFAPASAGDFPGRMNLPTAANPSVPSPNYMYAVEAIPPPAPAPLTGADHIAAAGREFHKLHQQIDLLERENRALHRALMHIEHMNPQRADFAATAKEFARNALTNWPDPL